MVELIYQFDEKFYHKCHMHARAGGYVIRAGVHLYVYMCMYRDAYRTFFQGGGGGGNWVHISE